MSRASFDPEHNSWRAMVERCTNKNAANYRYYGGRGITVHKDWIGVGGYQRFLAHVGRKSSPHLTIDRIDTNGNYEPGNVRWADRNQQSRGRRYCIRVAFNGEKMTLAEWSKKLGIPYETLRSRHQRGYPVEMLLAVGKSRSKPLPKAATVKK